MGETVHLKNDHRILIFTSENKSLDSKLTSCSEMNSSWIKCRNLKRKQETTCITERNLGNNLEKKIGVMENFLTKIGDPRNYRRKD